MAAGQYKISEPEYLMSGGVELTKNIGSTKLLLDLYYQYISGAPYYGTGATAQTLYKMPVYDRYIFKATYKLKNWSAFVSTVYEPREYSSDGMYASAGAVFFNPKSKWDFNAGIKYQF